MSKAALLLSALIWYVPICLYGQHSNCTLKGTLHVKTGKSFPYSLVFSSKGNEISGYSLTKLADGTEPKATINGRINSRLHTIAFKEKPSAESGNNLTCFVDAVLDYKFAENKYFITGDFRGKDIDGFYCGEGTIEFEQISDPTALFKNDKKLPAIADNNGKPETIYKPLDGEIEITSGVSKKFEWHTDTCTLEVYDGGVIDGDEVTIILNGQVLLNDYALAKQKKLIKLPLTRKENILTIAAEYEGKIPPNTANILLTDGNRTYKIKAFNRAGDKATITLYRK